MDALRRCVRGGREFGVRAIIVGAIDERAAEFYRHFDFHDLDQRRLGRRLSDIAAALDDGELAGVPTTQPRRTGGSGSERLTD